MPKIMKTVDLEEYTFGSSPACVSLVKILNERQIKSRKLKRIIDEFNVLAKSLVFVEDFKCKNTILDILKQHSLNKVRQLQLPTPISSLMDNIICYEYRRKKSTFVNL